MRTDFPATGKNENTFGCLTTSGMQQRPAQSRIKNGRIMGLNECELNVSTSPLSREDTKFPDALCARKLFLVRVVFFISFYEKI